MKYTIYHTQTGQIVRVVICDQSDLALQFNPENHAVLEGEFFDDKFYVEAGAPVVLPLKPSEHYTFDWATKQWTDPRTLHDLRDAKWAEVKRWRAAAVIAPLLDTRFGTFDADAQGLENIQRTTAGLREAASIGMAPASIEWTMADNSCVDLTPADLSEVATLLLARGNAAHERARVLRAQINATATSADLDAIAWA